MTSAIESNSPPKRPRRGRGANADDRRATVAEVEAALDETLAEVPIEMEDGLDVPTAISVEIPVVPDTVVTAGGNREAEPVDLEADIPERELASRGAVYLPRGRKYRLVEGGLEFDRGVTREEWMRDTRGLIAVKQKIDWALADALAFGQNRFGEDASQVLDDTPFATQTLWNLSYLARSIPRELRNENIPFYVQAEVAALPYDDQKAILEAAAEGGLKREEVRTRVRKARQENKKREAEGRPVPNFVPPTVDMRVGDATSLDFLPDGSIQFILTSPPYGIEDPERGEGMRKYRVDDDYRDWVNLMDAFIGEAARVLAPGGRLAINVPFDTWVGGEQGGQRSTLGPVLSLGIAHKLTYVTLINWDEGTISKSVARGSVDSASAPRVINRQEAIVIFCKGQYNRLEQMKQGNLTNDIQHDEWLDWTDGTWEIRGESIGYEGFGAAWPEEIARRLFKLFSFKEDIWLDPFAGSFTSALVGWRLGRTGYAVDIDPKQVESGRRRIAEAAGRL